MPHLSLKASAAVSALTLLGFAGHANAAPRPMLDSASLTILAADEENSEVQNLLDPESDNGTPGGDAATKPEVKPEPREEKAMEAKPSGGGGVDESTEVDKEEGK